MRKDNLFGETPLHYAIAACLEAPLMHLEVARLLIDRGADVNAKDESGDTPIDYAKRYVPKAGLLQIILTGAGAK